MCEAWCEAAGGLSREREGGGGGVRVYGVGEFVWSSVGYARTVRDASFGDVAFTHNAVQLPSGRSMRRSDYRHLARHTGGSRRVAHGESGGACGEHPFHMPSPMYAYGYCVSSLCIYAVALRLCVRVDCDRVACSKCVRVACKVVCTSAVSIPVRSRKSY